jgi:hypothetical protein
MDVNPDPYRGPVSFGLEVNVGRGVVAETWLNGILLARKEADHIAAQVLAIHHDVLSGDNQAEVRIGMPGMALDQPPQPWTRPIDQGAHADICLQGDVIRIAGDEMQVTTYPFARDSWSPDAAGAAGPSFPARISLSFVPHCQVPGPLWAMADRPIPDTVADAVLEQTLKLAGMIRAADWDGITNATANRHAFMARCYPAGPTAQERRQHDTEQMAKLFGHAGFRVDIAPPSRSRFRAQAAGRLFDWVRDDGSALVMLMADGMAPMPASFQFAQRGGQLAVVR